MGSLRDFIADFLGTGSDQPQPQDAGAGNASGEPGDGGLPGGVPDKPCGVGPCPQCVDSRQQSSACVLQAGHDGSHRCPHGDEFVEAAADKCLDLCPQFDGWCTRDKGHGGVHWCGKHEW